ncbi:MAG: hypothetical protein CL912_11535 [Deltaproteobacteria bacterium]|nr:hypothetical protein [Deltaproteobacteria bacterium]
MRQYICWAGNDLIGEGLVDSQKVDGTVTDESLRKAKDFVIGLTRIVLYVYRLASLILLPCPSSVVPGFGLPGRAGTAI